MFYLDEGMHSMACHSDIIILVFKPVAFPVPQPILFKQKENIGR